MAPNPNSAPQPATGGDAGRWQEFEATIAAHHADLHAFAYRILGGRAEAEDALQTAYVKVFRAVRAGNMEASISRPWLYRVVYRCCIDEFRRSARNQHDVLDEVVGTLRDQGAELGFVRALSQALLNLPVATRAVVVLIDVHGLSYDEAAALLEIPRGTVASRLNHARDALCKALPEYAPQQWRDS